MKASVLICHHKKYKYDNEKSATVDMKKTTTTADAFGAKCVTHYYKVTSHSCFELKPLNDTFMFHK